MKAALPMLRLVQSKLPPARRHCGAVSVYGGTLDGRTKQLFSLALSSLAYEKRNSLLSLHLWFVLPAGQRCSRGAGSVPQRWGSPLAWLGSAAATCSMIGALCCP